MRYPIFIRILDQIRAEAPEKNTRYAPDPTDLEKVNQARARAFIHLYLKVNFGIFDFSRREKNITDGSYDGGIDGYHIDPDTLTIYLIQSKFRTTENNFENKEIDTSELLSMDIDKIIGGDTSDAEGNDYNGKIKQLQREISQIPDVARYRYKIILLANLSGISTTNLRKLTDGLAAEVFDSEKTYQQLVFPVITGNYFTASDITIPIDLSNKNAGSKISYNVTTRFSDCEITVLFVPTLEVAKMMYKYKNAILKYNPRSYLEHVGQNVNTAIRKTILDSTTNEFALYNNGLTMLSEETNINEKIGQKNKAQLRIKNPQIINGGQTSFTLSRIYSENKDKAEAVFAEKEVLLKIITLLDNDSPSNKLALIDEISDATNKQTPVINADRLANEEFHKTVQNKVFEISGLLYERKRGEFADGVKDGYVLSSSIIERNLFWRICFASNGKINKGSQKKLFQKNDFSEVDMAASSTILRLKLGMEVFRFLRKDAPPSQKIDKATYALVYAYVEIFINTPASGEPDQIEKNIEVARTMMKELSALAKSKGKGPGFVTKRNIIDGRTSIIFSQNRYLISQSFETDAVEFFGGKSGKVKDAEVQAPNCK